MKKIMKEVGVFLYILGDSSLYGTAAQVLTAYLGGTSTNPVPVRVLNVPFDTAVASISTGIAFTGTDAYVAIAPDGSKVCYALSSTGGTTIGVIDPSTYAYTSVSGFNNPAGLAITPDSQYAYVPNKGTNTVSVLRLSDNTIVQTVTVGAAPSSVAFLPDGSKAYVVNSSGKNLSVIDTSTLLVTDTLTISGISATPNQIAINPVLVSGVRYAYITGNSGGQGLIVFNLGTNGVSFLTIPNGGRSLAVTPNGNTICVTTGGGTTSSPAVCFVNAGTLAVTAATGSNFSAAYGVAVNPDGTSAYVASGSAAGIGVFNIGSAALTRTITTNLNSGNLRGIALGYTEPLAAGSITGLINLSTAASAVTASVTNNTTATIYETLAAYQLDPLCLPPYSNCANWVANQTIVGTASSKTISAGGTNSSFSITTSGFSGYVR